MKIPYNCLEVRGHQLFASRGGFLFVQSLSNGEPIVATWAHPDVEKQQSAAKHALSGDSDVHSLGPDDVSVTSSPPPKKPRVQEPPAGEGAPEGQAEIPDEKTTTIHAQSNSKNNKKKSRHAVAPQVNRPLIVHLSVSSDGRYVALVSGHDKTVWVIENDGQGNLRELSRRLVTRLVTYSFH